MNNELAVTVLIGAPGTNGHRIFNRIVNDDRQARVTAIAPWPRSKATQEHSGLTLVRTTERLKRLGRGCSCCTVRADVLTKVRQIAEGKTADEVVIQVPPRSDLDALAKTFSVADEQGRVLGDVAYVDRVVTVVDGSTVLSVNESSMSQRLVELIRTADVVWVDGAAALASEQRAEVLEVVGVINPEAQILEGDDGEILLSKFQVEASNDPTPDLLALDAPDSLEFAPSSVLPVR